MCVHILYVTNYSIQNIPKYFIQIQPSHGEYQFDDLDHAKGTRFSPNLINSDEDRRKIEELQERFLTIIRGPILIFKARSSYPLISPNFHVTGSESNVISIPLLVHRSNRQDREKRTVGSSIQSPILTFRNALSIQVVVQTDSSLI